MTPASNRERLCEEADNHPDDARAQALAAFACDSEGREAEALVFYDRAWALGVPEDLRAQFLVGYGSTLKNLGRTSDSERVLRQALSEGVHPVAVRAFLALTAHAAGRSDEAVGSLLELLLEVAPSEPGLVRYQRALRFYATQLQR